MSPDEEVGARRLARASSAILPQPFPGAILPFHRAAPWTVPATCPRVSTSHSPPSKRRTVGDGQSRHCRRQAMGPTHPEAPTYLPSAPARRSCTCCPTSRRQTSRQALLSEEEPTHTASRTRTTTPRTTTCTTTTFTRGTSPATRATRGSRTTATTEEEERQPPEEEQGHRLQRHPRQDPRHPSYGHAHGVSVPCGLQGSTTR